MLHIPPDDTEFPRLTSVLRRRALPLLLTGALAGGAAYLTAERQTPRYDAVASLVAVRSDGGNDRVNASVFAAPSLPNGALPEALRSRGVLEAVQRDLAAQSAAQVLPPDTLAPLQRSLQAQLAGQESASLSVQVVGGGQQDGVFEVHGYAATPQGAQVLAEAGAEALLAWDAQRAQIRLERLRSSLQRQTRLLETRLGAALAPTASGAARLERQTLTGARAQVAQNLAQVTALQQSTSGSLERLAPAALPSRPTSPRPLRSGLLAAILALLLSSGAALLADRVRRTIYSEADLRSWPRPLLGHLPALCRDESSAALLPASGSGAWDSPAGFLGVNVLAQLSGGSSRRLVLTSTRQGEGSSTVTAALAASLAAQGQRVLIVDAGAGHSAQTRLWTLPDTSSERRSDASTPPQLQGPTVNLAPHLDLLPTTAFQRSGKNSLDLGTLRALLASLETDYDLVLIDAPALLTSPEAVSLAAESAGLLLLLVPGETSQHTLDSAFSVAQAANARILGLVFNERPAQARSRRAPLPAQGTLAASSVPGKVSAP